MLPPNQSPEPTPAVPVGRDVHDHHDDAEPHGGRHPRPNARDFKPGALFMVVARPVRAAVPENVAAVVPGGTDGQPASFTDGE